MTHDSPINKVNGVRNTHGPKMNVKETEFISRNQGVEEMQLKIQKEMLEGGWQVLRSHTMNSRIVARPQKKADCLGWLF